MKVSFYKNISADGSKIIRKATTDIFNMDAGLFDSDMKIETITVEPDPLNVSPDSDYGFTTTIINILDSA